MKKTVSLFILIVITACSGTKSTNAEKVASYYEGFITADYNQVQKTLADSLITIEGDFTTAFSRESYHEQFKWDSVFKPVHKLISIEHQGEYPIATISSHTSKFEFLKNNPLTMKYRFYFKSGKIAKIENIGFIGVNWETWQKELDALVVWIKDNHPELDGFNFDLTMKGAQNYLKAIELYNQREIKVME